MYFYDYRPSVDTVFNLVGIHQGGTLVLVHNTYTQLQKSTKMKLVVATLFLASVFAKPNFDAASFAGLDASSLSSVDAEIQQALGSMFSPEALAKLQQQAMEQMAQNPELAKLQQQAMASMAQNPELKAKLNQQMNENVDQNPE